MSNIKIPIVDNTLLDNTLYSIYVLGFSPASEKMLTVPTDSTTASFVKPTAATGNLPVYKLGTEITDINIDVTGTGAGDILGARMYFFIAENSKFSAGPVVTYSASGGTVIGVKNPPNSAVPPYTFTEFTFKKSYGSVIDIQTVDGFTFPVTIDISDSSGPLGNIGNPSTINRSQIIAAYKPFMQAIENSENVKVGIPYEALQYSENEGGLLNPGAFLNDRNIKNEFNNLDSALNSVFDDELNTLFDNTSLSVQGVSAKSKGGTVIEAAVYTGAVGNQKLPNSEVTHPALQFTSTSNSEKYNIYNPVGLSVLNYKDGDVNKAIIGTILNTTLTLENPIPGDTPLVAGMFIQGAGTSAGDTITAINKNAAGEIITLTLDKDLENPAPNSAYYFSKVSDATLFLTPGTSVFGNQGVFAAANGHAEPAATVIKNLQNQLVTALNRGVANLAPTSTKTPGYSTATWALETSWYPIDTAQNLFSYFMHTGTVNGTPIFSQPSDAVAASRGGEMGQAYGFAYDESPPSITGVSTQPTVPSKYDPINSLAKTVTITLGSWGDKYLSDNNPFVRDTLNDNGSVPHNGALNCSPDIIPVQTKVDINEVQADFGSATYGQMLGGNIHENQNNYIYLRAKNPTAIEQRVQISVYWARPSTFQTPSRWMNNQIGESQTLILPANGGVIAASNPAVWHADELPGVGHYCLITVLTGEGLPVMPTKFTTVNDWWQYCRDNNTVAQRNINIVEGTTSPVELTLDLINPDPNIQPHQIDAVCNVPEGSTVSLLCNSKDISPPIKTGPVTIRNINNAQIITTNSCIFPKGFEGTLGVNFTYPSDAPAGTYSITVKQYVYDGMLKKHLGTYTFELQI